MKAIQHTGGSINTLAISVIHQRLLWHPVISLRFFGNFSLSKIRITVLSMLRLIVNMYKHIFLPCYFFWWTLDSIDCINIDTVKSTKIGAQRIMKPQYFCTYTHVGLRLFSRSTHCYIIESLGDHRQGFRGVNRLITSLSILFWMTYFPITCLFHKRFSSEWSFRKVVDWQVSKLLCQKVPPPV